MLLLKRWILAAGSGLQPSKNLPAPNRNVLRLEEEDRDISGQVVGGSVPSGDQPVCSTG